MPAGVNSGVYVRRAYEITIVDRHATVVLNGEKVIDDEPVIGSTNGTFQSVRTISRVTTRR